MAAAAGLHGLVAALGNCGEVGMTGLTLGGGYGPLNGRLGLAADNLLGAELVLADGRCVTTGPEEEPELFWALRGGGGNFGVVTSMRVQLHEARHLLAGSIVYPWTEAEAVVRCYAAFAETMPDELGMSAIMTSGPDGQPTLMLSPLWSGDKSQGERTIGDLQTIGTPLFAQLGPMTYTEMLAPFDAWVAEAAGCHWEIRTRLTARAHAGRDRCDHQGGRHQDLSPLGGGLSPFPRRGHAHSGGGDRFRPAPAAFHGGDRRRLGTRRRQRRGAPAVGAGPLEKPRPVRSAGWLPQPVGAG